MAEAGAKIAQNENKLITAAKNTFENTNEYTQIDENMSIENGNKIQQWYGGHETTVHEKKIHSNVTSVKQVLD